MISGVGEMRTINTPATPQSATHTRALCVAHFVKVYICVHCLFMLMFLFGLCLAGLMYILQRRFYSKFGPTLDH